MRLPVDVTRRHRVVGGIIEVDLAGRRVEVIGDCEVLRRQHLVRSSLGNNPVRQQENVVRLHRL